MSNSVGEEGESSTIPNESAQSRTQSAWSRQRIGEFIEKYTYESFLIGTPLLIIGTFVYYNPVHSYIRLLVFLGLLMIFIGGALIWLPVIHWMSQTSYSSDSQDNEPVCEQTPPPFVPRLKPPDYDSLMPPGPQNMPIAPPAYDDIFQNLEQRPVFSQSSNNAVSEATVVPIHQFGSHSLTNELHTHLRNPQTDSSRDFHESQTGNSGDFHEVDTQPLLY